MGIAQQHRDRARKDIEAAAAQHPPPGLPERSILTAWVFVTEWLDPESDTKFLMRLDSADISTWVGNGMLTYARDELEELVDDEDAE